MRPRRETGAARSSRGGFSIIELLTVIIIIGILTSIAIAVAVYVNQRAARAQTMGYLERLKGALASYHSEFGIYPPCGVETAYESTNAKYALWTPPKNGDQQRFGLYYHLTKIPEADKWKSWTEGIPKSGEWIRHVDDGPGGRVQWSNSVSYFVDSWLVSFVYSSGPPYQAYVLFSTGPDKLTNTYDDIGNKTWAE